MDRKFNQSFIYSLPAILAVLLLISCEQNKPSRDDSSGEDFKNPAQSDVHVPDFNADTAYAFIAKQVSFGPRIPGTSAHATCAHWLEEKLRSYCKDVVLQDLQVEIYNGEKLPCKNLIASFNPQAEKRILLCAHWDTRPWSDRDSIDKKKQFDGADDGGSGVGVLLEIARQLSNLKTNAGIDIALFDVEDYGPPSWEPLNEDVDGYGIGTQHWANNPHHPQYRAYYGILLDMVGAKNATFLQEGTSMQYAPSVVRKVWGTANTLGYGNYFINEKANAVTDDHTYVNTINGTPCIDIINLNASAPNAFARHWHTQQDNMNVIDKNTLKAVGQTLLQVIYTELPSI
jgi:hypothetical protein